MTIVILIVAMIVVGLIMGAVSGLIWKDQPLSVRQVYFLAVVAAVVTGLVDWYVIPAMGFSETWKWLGVALEPPIVSLAAVWLGGKAYG